MAGAPERLEVPVRIEADVLHVVSAARHFCAGHGFTEVFGAHVATAAAELANNLWMYADRGGTVALRLQREGLRLGVELLAQDDGPGIANPALAMIEGFSSGGGLGCGLPGVQRLMDDFELHSVRGEGTRVRACKWLARGAARRGTP